jgi:hypothetical protein
MKFTKNKIVYNSSNFYIRQYMKYFYLYYYFIYTILSIILNLYENIYSIKVYGASRRVNLPDYKWTSLKKYFFKYLGCLLNIRYFIYKKFLVKIKRNRRKD